MPAAPLVETSKRELGSASKMADKEHSTAALGDSEVACVEMPPRHAIPEVGQLGKHASEVPTAVRGEQPGYVLDE